jgi:hypothetical protein
MAEDTGIEPACVLPRRISSPVNLHWFVSSMALTTGIKPVFSGRQPGVLSLDDASKNGTGFEPVNSECPRRVCLSATSIHGTPEGSRTPKILFLRQACIPIPSPGHGVSGGSRTLRCPFLRRVRLPFRHRDLVLSTGIEPVSRP